MSPLWSFFLIIGNLILPSCLHYVDHLSENHNVDPSAVVFPSSLLSPFSLPNRLASKDDKVDLHLEYLHAVEALFAVTTWLKTLLGKDETKNILVSPVSTTTALGEILLGARGESRRELLEILTTVNKTSGTAEATVVEFHQQLGGLIKQLQNSADYDSAYQLELASAVFLSPQVHLKRDFINAISDLYGVDIEPMDFSGDPLGALNAMNKWASIHTKGIIDKVFSEPLPQSTALVLTNAIYFKGDWETPFNPRYTVPGTFKINETHEVNVEYMRAEMQLNYVNSSRLGCRMIALPYKHSKAAMYIILPDQGNLYNIQEFTASLSVNDVRELISSMENLSVTVAMPKMTLTESFSIRRALLDIRKQIASGNRNKKFLQRPYEMSCNSSVNLEIGSNRRADVNKNTSRNAEGLLFDMSGASHDHSLLVDDIIHHIFLDVNEFGTVAAAVSATTFNKIADNKDFIIKRPFIFFIRHEVTGTPLFWGSIVDPTNSNSE
ncbi:hypothetical protein C0J52_24516 [Blattella germanica]|nr:hypothetical protein C0J52_24516 [Blattella germanica]